MNSSNDLLHEFSRIHSAARNPGFEVIVAFDYYDGPERGVALYPSGVGVRFLSLGDSKSRFFRAFELIPIVGDWWPEVRALQMATTMDPGRRVLVPARPSDELIKLERGVQQAQETGRFVSVGSPDFERILVSAVTQEQLGVLRQLGPSPACFKLVHQLLKGTQSDS